MVKQKAFTLIEMVIAITILGVTLALAYASLHVANRSMHAVANVQAEVEALRATYFLLNRHLSQADNRTAMDVSFNGEQDEISFFAPNWVFMG